MISKKRSAVIAVTGAMLFLLPASVLGMWTDSTIVSDNVIEAGSMALNVSKIGYFDVSDSKSLRDPNNSSAGSPKTNLNGNLTKISAIDDGIAWSGDDDTDFGHKIMDVDSWRMSPGDTVLALYKIDGTLSGKGLKANMSIRKQDGSPLPEVTNSDGTNSKAYSSATDDGFTIRYGLADNKGVLLNPATGQPASSDSVKWVNSPADLKFSATENTSDNLPKFDNNNQKNTADYLLALKVDFDADKQNLAEADRGEYAKQELYGLKFELKQEAPDKEQTIW